jgi:hypothetical protein
LLIRFGRFFVGLAPADDAVCCFCDIRQRVIAELSAERDVLRQAVVVASAEMKKRVEFLNVY